MVPPWLMTWRSCPGSWFRPSPSCASWSWTRPWIASWSWPAMASGMSCRRKGLGRGRGKWEDAKHGKICSQFIWIYDILWPVEGKGMNMMCFHAGIAMACDGLRFVHLSHCVIVTMHSATAHQLKWCRGSKHRKKKRKERKKERTKERKHERKKERRNNRRNHMSWNGMNVQN